MPATLWPSRARCSAKRHRPPCGHYQLTRCNSRRSAERRREPGSPHSPAMARRSQLSSRPAQWLWDVLRRVPCGQCGRRLRCRLASCFRHRGSCPHRRRADHATSLQRKTRAPRSLPPPWSAQTDPSPPAPEARAEGRQAQFRWPSSGCPTVRATPRPARNSAATIATTLRRWRRSRRRARHRSRRAVAMQHKRTTRSSHDGQNQDLHRHLRRFGCYLAGRARASARTAARGFANVRMN